VLEKQLEDRTYLVGERYSIADIANYAYTLTVPVAGLTYSDYPNVLRWMRSIESRSAVVKGQAVPFSQPIMGTKHAKLVEEDSGFRAQEEKLAKVLVEAKEQFGAST